MATFMKKFKRKRRLSTELHSRWGDVSITHPTQGSWNQRSQNSGHVANEAGIISSNVPHEEGEGQRHKPSGSLRQPSPKSSIRRSRSTAPREQSETPSPSFPTGHFNENIRHRGRDDCPPPVKGLGVGDLRRISSQNASSTVTNEDTSGSSCSDEDEERDVLTAPVGLSPRIYELADTSDIPHDNTEEYDVPAKAPPLSVTTRMRRFSVHSSVTEPTPLVSGDISSRRTSVTAASDVSATSMSTSTTTTTPRYRHNTHKLPPFLAKKSPPWSKAQEPEPATAPELVPSYDELYG
jgi:hypothetical protein